MLAEPAPRARPAQAELALWIIGAILVRAVACQVLNQPLVSDGLGYFNMAGSMSAGHWPQDQFGQHAFLSIGYPALIAPFFALFGVKVAVALAVNLVLGGASAALIRALAAQCGLGLAGQRLALAGYTLWLPGIWNATMLARENLSGALLLALALLALNVLRRGPRAGVMLASGLVWGAAVLAGSSALPLIAGPLVALLLVGARRAALASALLLLALGAALALAPWLWATGRIYGQPLLNTNTGFNLYIGNNPAATGRFVSVAATPAGATWHALREARGEVGASAELGRQARGWMLANPVQTVTLGVKKLVLFWAPNLPDLAGSKAIALIRIGELMQYLLFVTLGWWGLLAHGVAVRQRIVFATMVAGFWALHAIAYIIPRYRDPAVPLLIVLAAAVLARGLERWRCA